MNRAAVYAAIDAERNQLLAIRQRTPEPAPAAAPEPGTPRDEPADG